MLQNSFYHLRNSKICFSIKVLPSEYIPHGQAKMQCNNVAQTFPDYDHGTQLQLCVKCA